LLSRDDGEKVTGLQIQGRLTIDYQKLQNTFAASVSARQMFRSYDQLQPAASERNKKHSGSATVEFF
jgi:hypothetical protein